MERVIIVGGSFNPLHNGHLRIAIEAQEAFDAARIDFIPSFKPPHKQEEGLLPYELRVKALELALETCDAARINQFEALSDKPSYTYYTLQDYARREPGSELFFVLGSADFASLDSWHNWEELVNLANLVVVPRCGENLPDFLNTARGLWPGCEQAGNNAPGICLNPGTGPEAKQAFFLPVPRLDISSSLIREKWRHNTSLNFLVPQAALKLLRVNSREVSRIWMQEKQT